MAGNGALNRVELISHLRADPKTVGFDHFERTPSLSLLMVCSVSTTRSLS